ncbi:efflux RND transporter periplasmic adaptor subunit [Tautonia plasticadhaerens]|uniref:Macrolide export protein MacA n=1 Tax=Tautonia plasticadhaerens TaxID=2527974 RepID=A0A518GZH3_9BACT|nr:efflux RND transporter periplasmic adaptor subunit [Tautonia plasticadhaerens]QDV33995.1 Macrolide export protein MacA [Tautonia plasticadhaerens]
MILGVAGSAVGFAYVNSEALDFGFGGPSSDLPISSLVRRGTLRIVVTERGNLQSTKTVDGICEVQGREIKIIELVPEGTEVEQGQVVCRFDTSEIDQNVAQQEIKVQQAQSKIETTEQELEIQRNEAESKVQEAEVELTLARIDLEKYVEGDFPAEIKDLRGNIALARMEVERSAEKLEQFRELVRKGFRSPEQLRAVEQEYEQFKNYMERDVLKLDVKENYERRRMVTEHTSKVSQARSKVVRSKANRIAQVAKAESEHNSAKATFDVEQRQLDTFQEMKEKCTIIAEQSGVVAYANEAWYDSSRQIREGAMVYFRQKIFSLPDMDSMQVSVNVHESMVKKVEAGQPAEVRLDSFPGLVLKGTVKSVAQLADSNRSWMSGGSKEYATVVAIDEMPDEELRPDMTAEVRILARTIPDALIVPVSAVAAHKGEHYAFVIGDGDEIGRRPVEIGDSNETHVQVSSGLDEGDRVTHDARTRLQLEFGDDTEGEDEPAPTPAPSPGTSPA